VLCAKILIPAILLGSTLTGTAAAASTVPSAAMTDSRAIELPALSGGKPTLPQHDPFYTQATDYRHARPGELLRYRKSQVYLPSDLKVPAPVQAWQVIYRSTDAAGGPDAVSGTVLVPEAPWSGPEPRPIVSYGVGAHGLGDQCAPSYWMASGTEGEVPRMLTALSHGWALAITDYEGLGTPPNHTYVVALSEGRAALDVTRTAMRLPGAELSERAPVGLWGYSQGGSAIGSAAEQARSYAPELHIIGVAEGGVPADIQAVGRNVDGGAIFGVLAGAAAGFDTAYPDLRLSDLFNAKGHALLKLVRTECSADQGTNQANHYLSEYTNKPDALDYPSLVRVLRANRIGSRSPGMPVYLYHAQFDELVPPAVAQNLFREYCSRRVQVAYTVIPLTEHVLAADAGAFGAVSWLASRFAGLPAPGDCLLGNLPVVG